MKPDMTRCCHQQQEFDFFFYFDRNKKGTLHFRFIFTFGENNKQQARIKKKNSNCPVQTL